jgi:hypothetical protein
LGVKADRLVKRNLKQHTDRDFSTRKASRENRLDRKFPSAQFMKNVCSLSYQPLHPWRKKIGFAYLDQSFQRGYFGPVMNLSDLSELMQC